MRIAIIGAGVSGLCAARKLIEADHSVTLFEKARGRGGRLSTRYAGAYEFDHGAQYFTVTDAQFGAYVNAAETAGAAARWDGRALYLKTGLLTADTGRDRWVGTPRMNSFAKFLGRGMDILTGHRVTAMQREKDGSWTLSFGANADVPVQDRSGYDAVICTAPPEQALALLPSDFAEREALTAAKMNACFALMIGLTGVVETGWDSLRVSDLPVAWLAVNSAKPDRIDNHGALVVHAAPEWSNSNLETPLEDVQATLMDVAAALTRLDLTNPEYVSLHRWLYASVAQSPERPFLGDPEKGLYAIGDWCTGGRVEGAALSGFAVAEVLIARA